MTLYNVVRFFKNRIRNRKIMLRGVTLEIAQLHCSDPRSMKAGFWFDGYEEIK
jgi:hypothetical protein